MYKPIKRHKALQPVSREDHFGLLLSWKIRQGFKLNIEVKRIKAYTNWFWTHHLVPHFNFEEQYMFPILRNNHNLNKRAIKEHNRLQRLFTAIDKIERNLWLIEEEHEKVITEEWQDQFWLKNLKAS